jgi:hypothetical protein
MGWKDAENSHKPGPKTGASPNCRESLPLTGPMKGDFTAGQCPLRFRENYASEKCWQCKPHPERHRYTRGRGLDPRLALLRKARGSSEYPNTMDAGLRGSALEDAMNRYGVPERFNTHQANFPAPGCQRLFATPAAAPPWMAGPLDGQAGDRTALELAEMRMCLSAGVRDRL